MNLETIDEIVTAIRRAPEMAFGDLTGTDAKEAALALIAGAYNEKHPSIAEGLEKASVGHLKWAEGEEQFPAYQTLGWDLTIDDFGRVRVGIVLRDAEGYVQGGVQLDSTDLMQLSRYCFSHATLRLNKDYYDPLGAADLTYLKEHVLQFISDVRAHCPEVFEDMIGKAAMRSVADEAMDLAKVEYNARLQGEIRAMEKRWAKSVVRLSSIAAREDAMERDERLNDPLLQDVITRAFQIGAES